MHHRHSEHRHHSITDELFPTEPPCKLDDPLHPLEIAGKRPRNASGSADSPDAVEPTTSQNSTDTTFRCSPDPLASAAPHPAQNLLSSEFLWPQEEQATINGA